MATSACVDSWDSLAGKGQPGKIRPWQRPPKNTSWTPFEVSATERSYLDMLVQELAGQRDNKSACRKLLFETLQGARSQASIEFKYCNISAVMQLLHYPSINGYQR